MRRVITYLLETNTVDRILHVIPLNVAPRVREISPSTSMRVRVQSELGGNTWVRRIHREDLVL